MARTQFSNREARSVQDGTAEKQAFARTKLNRSSPNHNPSFALSHCSLDICDHNQRSLPPGKHPRCTNHAGHIFNDTIMTSSFASNCDQPGHAEDISKKEAEAGILPSHGKCHFRGWSLQLSNNEPLLQVFPWMCQMRPKWGDHLSCNSCKFHLFHFCLGHLLVSFMEH